MIKYLTTLPAYPVPLEVYARTISLLLMISGVTEKVQQHCNSIFVLHVIVAAAIPLLARNTTLVHMVEMEFCVDHVLKVSNKVLAQKIVLRLAKDAVEPYSSLI